MDYISKRVDTGISELISKLSWSIPSSLRPTGLKKYVLVQLVHSHACLKIVWCAMTVTAERTTTDGKYTVKGKLEDAYMACFSCHIWPCGLKRSYLSRKLPSVDTAMSHQ